MVIASGADPKYNSKRTKIYDHRPANQKNPELTSQVGSKITKNGYIVEYLLPWKNLSLKPKQDLKLAFQFVANDFKISKWSPKTRV
jgi:hypothetical protein